MGNRDENRLMNHQRVLQCVQDGLNTSGKIKTATSIGQPYVCRILEELERLGCVVHVANVSGKRVWRPAGWDAKQAPEDTQAIKSDTDSAIRPLTKAQLMAGNAYRRSRA